MKTAEKLTEAVDRYDKEHGLAGAISITKDGETLLRKAYGKASLQLGVPNTVHTRFHIASVTKMFIAAAALRLEEQGLIDLRDAPGVYLERLRSLDPRIILHHLLSHTSGLHDIYGVENLRFEMSRLKLENGDFMDYLAKQEQLVPSRRQMELQQHWLHPDRLYTVEGIGPLIRTAVGRADPEAAENGRHRSGFPAQNKPRAGIRTHDGGGGIGERRQRQAK